MPLFRALAARCRGNMKFSEELITRSEYPQRVVGPGFRYAHLKEQIRSSPEWIRRRWVQRLHEECARAERLLFPRYRLCAIRLPPAEVLELSTLWSTAFRKICKALERRLGLPALKFHASVLSAFTYAFLGGAKRAALHIQLECGGVIDCPLCLDTRDCFLVLRYSHAVCEGCAAMLWAPIGEKSAIAGASMWTPCPVCRAKLAAHPFFTVAVTKK